MNQPVPTISRRHFFVTAAAATAAASLHPRALWAQEQPSIVIQGRANGAKAKITTQSLRGNISAMLGAGGNIAVLPGKDGKVLIDSGFSTSRPQIIEALAAISPDPMTHLINTHWHFDHTDGNEWMHSAGATVIAHENCRTRLSTPQEIAAFKANFPPSPAGAIPTLVFAKDDAVKLNGANLALRHYDPAHTDTDISIYFAEADVLHLGDTWFNGFYPFIDYSTGGSINGMIRATERNLAAATADTIIIPGHGPVGNRAQLTEFHDMLVGTRENIAKLKKEGKSLDETIAAKPTAAYDEKWGKKPEAFIGYVYQGI